MSAMSLPSVTNQRLDAAKRLLSMSQQSEGEWIMKSFDSSAIFQLRSALNGLLQEVKSAHSLSSPLELTKLIEAANAKGLSVPVLSELSLLQGKSNSWLNQLLQSYQVALECQVSASSSSSSGVELIGRGSDAGASTQFILSSLTELVLRYREDAAEY